MLFVIKYDRDKGVRTLLEQFADDEFDRANRRRTQVEIDSISECDRVEVVMLEAESLETLQTTHRRYFANANQMADRLSDPEHLRKGPKPQE